MTRRFQQAAFTMSRAQGNYIAQGKLSADLAVALGEALEADSTARSSSSTQDAYAAYARALRAHPSHAGAKAHLARLVRE